MTSISTSNACSDSVCAELRIAIDFDNTIACYDQVMASKAVAAGWFTAGEQQDKKAIRDRLRALPDGENLWRSLQTHAYGDGMVNARPMPGVKEFFAWCRRQTIPVWIVSHKTEYNNFGPPTIKLRETAFSWLLAEGFFAADSGLTKRDVYFESTRQEKIARIACLAPSHFIDDLEETFLEPAFPAQVSKIHFVPHGEPSKIADAVCADSWAKILQYFRALHGATGRANPS